MHEEIRFRRLASTTARITALWLINALGACADDGHRPPDASSQPEAAPKICTADAAKPYTDVLEPADATSPCPPGYWQNTGFACGPFGATCRPYGDGLCYRLCAASSDCPDPCAPACTRLDYFRGGDTPSGRVLACSPGQPADAPPACTAALRDCLSACKTAGQSRSCSEDCFVKAKECAVSTCAPIHDRCIKACYDASPDANVINPCVEVCNQNEYRCWGAL
jgi:hypothetical protein